METSSRSPGGQQAADAMYPCSRGSQQPPWRKNTASRLREKIFSLYPALDIVGPIQQRAAMIIKDLELLRGRAETAYPQELRLLILEERRLRVHLISVYKYLLAFIVERTISL